MPEFSLSRSRENVLPEAVIASDGQRIPVDADFRTVLRCLNALRDPDAPENDKLLVLMMNFFKGARVWEAVNLFAGFLSDGEDDDSDPAKMDFEQDADVIYASFLSEYGIDLLDIPYLHWFKFRALLAGLTEKSALQSRIQLRELDTSKLKGKEKLKAEKAKRKVQLRERVSAEDEALCEELEKALAEGRDPSEVLKKLKNG